MDSKLKMLAFTVLLMLGIFRPSAADDVVEISAEGATTVGGAKVDQIASLSSTDDEEHSEEGEEDEEDDDGEVEDGDEEDEEPVLLQEDIDSLFADVDQDGDGKISLADLGADMKKARDEEL